VSQRYVAAAFLNGWARRLARGKPRSRQAALPLSGIRITRPTARLEAMRAFYGEGLGLRERGSGASFGVPDEALLLEFVSPRSGPDSRLILELESAEAVQAVVERLAAHGYPAFTAEGRVTVADPDGWPIVLVGPPHLVPARAGPSPDGR
jgi:catechol 2,3-dioxygenase-like lactoylglutathione lyase family enzyme